MKEALSRKIDKHFLLVASTEKELSQVRSKLGDNQRITLLCCGVGPAEAAYNLSRCLAEIHENLPSGVINFGIGGAYPETGVKVLDLCLATAEVLADLGVGDGLAVNFLVAPNLKIKQEFRLDRQAVLIEAVDFLTRENISFHKGNFVTLNCASGTRARGEFFRDKHGAICENMEGGALARVCEGFGVDFLECRIISNMVEDRDTGAAWPIDEACETGGRLLNRLVLNLLKTLEA